MVVKASLVVIGDMWEALRSAAEPDRAAADPVIRALHPEYEVEPIADSTLAREVFPHHPQHAYVAVLPEATIVCDRVIEVDSVLEFAAGRPVAVFERDSGSFSLTEWSEDGYEVEPEDEDETADEAAARFFGLADRSTLEGIVVQGFRLIHPQQAEIDAAVEAAVAKIRAAGFTAPRPGVTP